MKETEQVAKVPKALTLNMQLEYYQKIFQSSPQLVLIWQWNGQKFTLVEYNHTARSFIGEVPGMNIHQYFYDSPAFIEGMKKCLVNDEILERKALFRLRDINECKWVSTKIVPLQSDRVVVYIELHAGGKLTEKLQLALYRISETASSARDLDELYRAVHSIVGELISADNFYIALYDEQARMTHFPYRVDKYDSAKSRPARRGMTEYVIRTGKPVFVNPELHEELMARGEVDTSGARSKDWLGVPLKMANHKVFGVMAVQTYDDGIRYTEQDRDILTFVSNQVAMAIERKQAEENLRFLSLHDALTLVYNRAYFEDQLTGLQNADMPLAVIVCDIDGLKLVNDTMGHQAGDELLKAAARIISMNAGDGHVVARIGGDEFAILMPEVDELGADTICDKIRFQVAQYNHEHARLPLSISLGYAVRPDKGMSLQDLLQRADRYMYREKLQQSRGVHSDIVQTVMKLLEARDWKTEGHAERVQSLILKLAGNIGLPKQRVTELSLFSRFHDIGKVGISDHILFKPGALNKEERKEMERHSEIGFRIAQVSSDLLPIADWILKHHEWWNGQGYPLGVSGENIPLECRILAIVDAYDAMISDRPYRQAMSHRAAIAELKRSAGTQFDPELVKKFISMIKCQFLNDNVDIDAGVIA